MRAFVVVLVCVARSAFASGLCENTPTHYDPPELYNPATRSFAIPATKSWCDDGTGHEVRGTIKYVELISSKGTLGRLSDVTGDDAKRVATWTDFELISHGTMHAELVKRGYASFVAPKLCKLAAEWTDIDPPGWRAATLRLAVTVKAKRIATIPFAAGSEARRADVWLRSAFDKKRGSVTVIGLVPDCSGPPPGHFGSGDAGSCYVVETPVLLTLDEDNAPGCF